VETIRGPFGYKSRQGRAPNIRCMQPQFSVQICRLRVCAAKEEQVGGSERKKKLGEGREGSQWLSVQYDRGGGGVSIDVSCLRLCLTCVLRMPLKTKHILGQRRHTVRLPDRSERGVGGVGGEKERERCRGGLGGGGGEGGGGNEGVE
jgi:hypothetical protein